MQLRKALEVADAREWSGDIRVNFLTAIKAAAALARQVRAQDVAIAKLKRESAKKDTTIENFEIDSEARRSIGRENW